MNLRVELHNCLPDCSAEGSTLYTRAHVFLLSYSSYTCRLIPALNSCLQGVPQLYQRTAELQIWAYMLLRWSGCRSRLYHLVFLVSAEAIIFTAVVLVCQPQRSGLTNGVVVLHKWSCVVGTGYVSSNDLWRMDPSFFVALLELYVWRLTLRAESALLLGFHNQSVDLLVAELCTGLQWDLFVLLPTDVGMKFQVDKYQKRLVGDELVTSPVDGGAGWCS